MDAYADAVVALESAVDDAVSSAMENGGLTHREVATELRKIAQGWEDAA